MSKLNTMYTEIRAGKIKFNAPISYDIVDKNSGKRIATIDFHNRPVKENGINGVFIEDLLLICIDQLEHFQDSEFKCKENEDTLRHLRDALYSTRSRQYERLLRGVQGRNEK